MKTIKTNEETVKKLFLNKVMDDNWYEKIEIVKIENVQDYDYKCYFDVTTKITRGGKIEYDTNEWQLDEDGDFSGYARRFGKYEGNILTNEYSMNF